ncbi:MAG: hypothetical protein GWO24_21945, partial [Akkermansiaceae bacterium]|nr:hypothetical protein [Akkermansiaceae bacterium]
MITSWKGPLCALCVLCGPIATAEKRFTAEASKARPNVVIFFTDDQGTLDANCYGSTD